MSLNALRRLVTGTVRRRLTFGMAMVVAAMMTLAVVELTRRAEAMAKRQQVEQAAALAQAVAKSASVWLASRDYAGLREIVQGLTSYPDLRHAIVTDARGQILAHTDMARVGLYLCDFPAKIQPQILKQSQGLVDAACPVQVNHKPIGWVRVGLGGQALMAELNLVRSNGLLYGLVAIALSSLAAALTGRALTRRLYAIQHVTNAVETGEFGLRVQLDGEDEPAQLARQFNLMLDSLDRQRRELMDSEQLFRSATDSSPLAVYMSAGPQRRGVYVNPTFMRLFGYGLTELPTANALQQLAFPDLDYPGGEGASRQPPLGQAMATVASADHVERQITCKDGSVRCVSWGMVSNGLQHWAFGLDMTERRQAEAALREHQQLLGACRSNAVA